MNNPHNVLFAVITVSFLALAGVLIVFSADPSLHTLAASIIGGLLMLWVPSPIQQKATDLRPLIMEMIQEIKATQKKG